MYIDLWTNSSCPLMEQWLKHHFRHEFCDKEKETIGLSQQFQKKTILPSPTSENCFFCDRLKAAGKMNAMPYNHVDTILGTILDASLAET